jgi:hypothetical protein
MEKKDSAEKAVREIRLRSSQPLTPWELDTSGVIGP